MEQYRLFTVKRPQSVYRRMSARRSITHEIPERSEARNSFLLARLRMQILSTVLRWHRWKTDLHHLRVSLIVGRDKDNCRSRRQTKVGCGVRNSLPSAFHEWYTSFRILRVSGRPPRTLLSQSKYRSGPRFLVIRPLMVGPKVLYWSEPAKQRLDFG